MSGIGFILGVGAIVVPLLVGWGVAVLSLTPEDFRAARWSFSLAAIILVGITVLWSCTTNDSLEWRVSVDASCAIAVGCLLPAGLLWISRRQSLSRAPLPTEPLLPQITALTPIVRQAYRDDDGIVHLGRGPVEVGMQTMRFAILAPFKNMANVGRPTRDAQTVSASIVFNNADGWPVTGAWLKSATHTVDMPIGSPEQFLVMAFAEEGHGAFLISDERHGVAGKMTPISFFTYPKDGQAVHHDFGIKVDLMESGHLVLTAKYLVRMTLPYPQVSLIATSIPSALPEAAPDGAEPDVLLAFADGQLSVRRESKDSLEPINIDVYNDSHLATAMDIGIATLSSGAYGTGSWSGDAATPAGTVTVSTTIRFEPIPHLQARQHVDAMPINPAFSMPERMLKHINNAAPGLWWFVDAARKSREREELERVTGQRWAGAPGQVNNTPIDIPMRVTYRNNAEPGRRWERMETLHYGPETLTAYITHGKRSELLDSNPRPDQPIAVIQSFVSLAMPRSPLETTGR